MVPKQGFWLVLIMVDNTLASALQAEGHWFEPSIPHID